ncbi:MAG: hypothetical protein IT423_02530 [Pirellulaceae bacterium]|nr:hypothetical protein [Pirellulaceae bacterium]
MTNPYQPPPSPPDEELTIPGFLQDEEPVAELDSSNDVRIRFWQAVRAWRVLLGICVIFMLGNLSIPSLVWRVQDRSWLMWGVFFCDGIVASQIAIVAGWLAYRVERWSHRAIAGTLLVGMLCSSFVIGLQLAEKPSTMPMEAVFFFYAVAFAGSAMVWAGLACVRWRFPGLLVGPDDGYSYTRRGPLSLVTILSAMTVIALIVAIIRSILPNNSSMPPFDELFALTTIFLVYSLVLFMFAFWLGIDTLKPHQVFLLVWLLLVALLAGGYGVMVLVSYILSFTPEWHAQIGLYAFALGFVVSVIFSFRLLRGFGFRILGVGSS